MIYLLNDNENVDVPVLNPWENRHSHEKFID